MYALVLALAVAAPAEASPTVDAPRAPPKVFTLDRLAQVRAFCDALEPPERAAAGKDAIERGRDEAARAARREATLGARYRVIIPPERLAFAPYDAEDQELTLSDRAWLAAAGGALSVWAAEDPGLPVRADPAAAERIVKGAARKAVALRLTFTVPDEDATCAHPAGARAWALGVEPLSWEYVEGERVLARGGEGGDRPLVSAAQGGRPRVEVAEPLGAEGSRDLRAAVVARAPQLHRCYTQALAASPALDGAVVAEVELGPEGGVPHGVRIAADSVQDDAMLGCVKGVLAATPFPKGRGAVVIPIHFELETPQAENG